MPRMVLPAGAVESDLSWIERGGMPLTWAQVARENGVEIADDAWLAANNVATGEGYGIVPEALPIPDPIPEQPSNTAAAADALDALAAQASASALSDVRDLGTGLAGIATALRGA